MRIRTLPLAFVVALAVLSAVLGQPSAPARASVFTPTHPAAPAPDAQSPPAKAADQAPVPLVAPPPSSSPAPAAPATGSLSYRARVVHNNRACMSIVSGEVDLASGDFSERVDQSWLL